MSQTSPQRAGLDHRTLGLPENTVRPPSISATLSTSSVGDTVISSSDNGDMRTQEQIACCGPNGNKNITPNFSRNALHSRGAFQDVPPKGLMISRTIPRANFADNAGEGNSPHNATAYRAPTKKCEETTASAATSFGSAHTGIGAHMGGTAGPPWRLPSLIPPDMIDNLLGPPSSFIEIRAAPSPAPVPMEFQRAGRPPYKDSVMPRPRNTATNISQHTSQPQPDTNIMPGFPDLVVEHVQPAARRPVQRPSIPPLHMSQSKAIRDTQTTTGPAPLENTKTQGRMRIFWRPQKHAVRPPRDNAAKRRRDGFEPKEVYIADFKYRTLKAIQMPARDDVPPGRDPPEPTPENLPYGDDIDFQTSMLLYWLDEKELTYTECARRFRTKFSGETATNDTIRHRHHSALIKLARKYGLKPENELEEPSKSVTRRGQQAGHRYNTIGKKIVYYAGANPDIAATSRGKKVSEPTADREFLKACICVWKDTSDVSFTEIQQRLAREYSWDIGANTVQKLYYQERGRVYNTYDDKSNGAKDERGTEETVETAKVSSVQAGEVEDDNPHITAS